MKKTKKLKKIVLLLLVFSMITGIVYYGNRHIPTSGDFVSAKTDNEKIKVKGEVRAVWVAFCDFSKKKYTYSAYKKKINSMFNKIKKGGFNTIYMHVRPFADAMYPSSYFPWSRIISGKAGRNPGFDPFAYAVKAAHSRNLAIHAWINPYRISGDFTNISKLPKNSIARKWAASSKASDRRKVLTNGNQLFFNPSNPEVQQLVVNGVVELLKKYPIEGIHFDDYFYPNLGAKYKKNFDAKEYKKYVKTCRKNGKTATNIVNWRRNNVNTLLKKVYAAVHNTDKDAIFGVSPAGNISNLYLKNNYYADVKTWMGNKGYIDYICPQIYWSFTQKVCPFKATAKKWANIPRDKSVALHVGLASYRAGISRSSAKAMSDTGWSKSNTVLKREMQYARKTGYSGCAIYSVSDFYRNSATKELKNLKSVFH